jgi:hypothetical protein
MTAPHRLPMNILFSEESSHSAEFRTNQSQVKTNAYDLCEILFTQDFELTNK